MTDDNENPCPVSASHGADPCTLPAGHEGDHDFTTSRTDLLASPGERPVEHVGRLGFSPTCSCADCRRTHAELMAKHIGVRAPDAPASPGERPVEPDDVLRCEDCGAELNAANPAHRIGNFCRRECKGPGITASPGERVPGGPPRESWEYEADVYLVRVDNDGTLSPILAFADKADAEHAAECHHGSVYTVPALNRLASLLSAAPAISPPLRDETVPPPGWVAHPLTDETCMRLGGIDLPLARAWAIYDAEHGYAPSAPSPAPPLRDEHRPPPGWAWGAQPGRVARIDRMSLIEAWAAYDEEHGYAPASPVPTGEREEVERLRDALQTALTSMAAGDQWNDVARDIRRALSSSTTVMPGGKASR